MDNHYDAIVIGSGLGGLAAGARYARQGKRVLVLERHDKFGGAATVYRKQKMDVDVGLHELDGLDDGDIKRKMWTELGLDRRLKTVLLPEFYALKRAGDPSVFYLPHGRDAVEEVLAKRFPHQKQALAKYFRVCTGLRSGITGLLNDKKTITWWLSTLPKSLMLLLRYNNSTVLQFLQDLFGNDEEIKLVVAANLSYYGQDPGTLSTIFYGIAQASFYIGGGHYIKGGSQALSNALVDIIIEAGGQAVIRRNVTKILTAGNQVTGVAHEKMLHIVRKQAPGDPDRQEAFAPVIFGNAAPSILKEMLPENLGKKFYQRYKQFPLSPSLWVIYLGFNKKPSDFGVHHYSTFIIPEHIQTFRDYTATHRIFLTMPSNKYPVYAFTDYSLIDSGLNTSGRYLACMCGLDHIDNWQHLSDEEYYRKKEAWQEALIDHLNDQFPGIKEAIVFQEMGTARTMRDYLNTPGGCTYGFEARAPFFRQDRSSPRTTVKGLYLASAFTMGGGFAGALLSGDNAAKMALAAEGIRI
ncbi:MAG: NAD(P)/FAD-dependent oxidoreductase [bacterium]|nr:NAD(P)/FAD-dependent oxidoreductase [bacterium]